MNHEWPDLSDLAELTLEQIQLLHECPCLVSAMINIGSPGKHMFWKLTPDSRVELEGHK